MCSLSEIEHQGSGRVLLSRFYKVTRVGKAARSGKVARTGKVARIGKVTMIGKWTSFVVSVQQGDKGWQGLARW